MKAKATNSASAPPRCQHQTPGGRQCCSPVSAPGSILCARHAASQPEQFPDVSADLFAGCTDFQEAQQINHSLIALYRLVAQGRISPRRGAVLGFIGSLVLRSLKSVDYDLDRFTPDPDADSDEDDETLDLEAPAQSVPPGKEPLPATAQEFAAKVLDRKPN